mmetsp:Transcript_17716/g.29136  ORF Transcript_17716/g.29136 Transcript_17716/m.29136 type:complete len:471 (+) Transcript_17716:65-1477(+)
MKKVGQIPDVSAWQQADRPSSTGRLERLSVLLSFRRSSSAGSLSSSRKMLSRKQSSASIYGPSLQRTQSSQLFESLTASKRPEDVPEFLQSMEFSKLALGQLWAEYLDKPFSAHAGDLIGRLRKATESFEEEIKKAKSELPLRAPSSQRPTISAVLSEYEEACELSKMQLASLIDEPQRQERVVSNLESSGREALKLIEESKKDPAGGARHEDAIAKLQHWLEEVKMYKAFRGEGLHASQIVRLKDVETSILNAQSQVRATGSSVARPQSAIFNAGDRRMSRVELDKIRAQTRRKRSTIIPDGASEPLNKYRVIKIAGDGRCMFRSVICARAVAEGFRFDDDTEKKEADRARQMVVDIMMKNKDEFMASGVVEEDFGKHCEMMRKSNTYGGEPELLVLTHVIEAPIAVLLTAQDCFVEIQRYGRWYDRSAVRLLYNGKDHYNCLVYPDDLVKAKLFVSESSFKRHGCTIL